MELARDHDLKVIEDCAQAHGAMYRGRPLGTIGDLAAFSFCQDKIITTGGEGGLLTTNDDELWRRAWAYKDHGKSWDAVYNHQHPQPFRWLHESFGTNWRLTEMQATLGRIALQRLPQWIEARRRHAAIWTTALAEFDAVRLTYPPDHVRHSYYKYYAFLEADCLRPGWTRDSILRAIEAEGVPCGSGSCSEIYLEKAFDNHPSRPTQRLPVAKQLGETSLMFLVDPALSDEDVLQMTEGVAKVLRVATLSNAALRTAQAEANTNPPWPRNRMLALQNPTDSSEVESIRSSC
jgi:dTDP-4-amino-4,6-dideoxygalactose transaminase